MKLLNLRKKLFAYLALSALLTLALLLVQRSETDINAFFGAKVEGRMAPDAGANFIKLILFMGLALVLVRLANTLFFGGIARLSAYRAPALVRNIFSIVIYISAFVILFKWFYPGVELTPLFATSTIFGLILGLALQDTLGNLFAGISLQADKPFVTGDVVTVGNKTGVVESVTWRGVRIRTFTNHIVFISNSSIAKENLEVCPSGNLNARLVFFNTLYTDSPAKTIHVVRDAIREAENISREKKPIVRIRSLAADGIDWEVKYWAEDYAKYNDTDALVRQLIWYAFQRANINFAFPTRTIYWERQKPEKASPTNKIFDRLSAVEIFEPLSDTETERLAAATSSHVFAAGEYVIRSGAEGSSMFVIHKGRVKVQISDNGKPRTVATLNEGDFFGEMALLTGEPRTANIVASEETEVLEIGHAALKQLFDANPDLIEALGNAVTERRAGLAAQQGKNETAATESAGLLNAIRRFFS